MYTSELLLLLFFGAILGVAFASGETGPVVDLDYGIYEGYYNSTSNLNIFKGIPYATSPTGNLRWQKPQGPPKNRTRTILALEYPPACPQSPAGPLANDYSFNTSGNEDCLFVSVFAAPTAYGLPVMVWIHGGGYGTGQGNNEFWELLQSNDNAFIIVLIQYRLGAFGFLSSDDFVLHGGVPNVGIHDMRFSLDWVQSHIDKFGGDPEQVTIAGESAGGGAVMLLSIANGGTEGTSLFTHAIDSRSTLASVACVNWQNLEKTERQRGVYKRIVEEYYADARGVVARTASPYLPQQWDYDDTEPTQAYHDFATAAGCVDAQGHSYNNRSILDCLTLADTVVLQNASAHVSGGYKYGQWAFVPVTDTKLISERPSVQLNAGSVNGLRMLTSNNADEGQGFTPQNITSASDFKQFLTWLMPTMDANDVELVLGAYAIAPVNQGPLFSTFGDHGPTALNQSEFGIGQQQRANNLYAEITFVCPSYWLANAFSGQANDSNSGKRAWKYQFSVPPSEHGADLDAYQAFNRETLGLGTMTDAARKAIQLAWGRFIIHGEPSLPKTLVKSLSGSVNGTTMGDGMDAIATGNWIPWSRSEGVPQMLNVNMQVISLRYIMVPLLHTTRTGGVPELISWAPVGGSAINITQMVNPGLEAQFRIVNAESWEGGRGGRCELWRKLGATVPE